MHKYESLLIIRPELGEDKVKEKIDSVEKIIKKNGGSIIKIDDWGKKRLAYRIQKVRNGVYVLITYKILPIMVLKVERGLKLEEHIIKFTTIKLNEKEAGELREEDNQE